MKRSKEICWAFLEERPHPWRRQLYVKGRRLRAFTIWMDMLTNNLTLGEAAASWDVPPEAVEEIVRYCEANRQLLQAEADEERRRLEDEGVPVEPAVAPR